MKIELSPQEKDGKFLVEMSLQGVKTLSDVGDIISALDSAKKALIYHVNSHPDFKNAPEDPDAFGAWLSKTKMHETPKLS